MTAFGVVNMAWQNNQDKKLLAAVAATFDVLLLVECRTRDNRPLKVKDLLPDGWIVGQDTRDSQRSGCAIAVRETSGVALERFTLIKTNGPQLGIQTRYLLDARLRDEHGPFRAGVVHRPLKTVARARAQSDLVTSHWVMRRKATAALQRRLKRQPLRWLLAGDGNANPEKWARDLGAPHVLGRDVMALMHSDGWGAVRGSAARLPGSDHHVLRWVVSEESS